MNKKIVLGIGAIFCGLAVLIDAFGAHALDELLIHNNKVSVFDTASKYHFYHSFGLLLIGLTMGQNESTLLKSAAFCFIGGIILFSGSLYALSLSNISKLGAITPFGGVLFILGWSLLSIKVFRKL